MNIQRRWIHVSLLMAVFWPTTLWVVPLAGPPKPDSDRPSPPDSVKTCGAPIVFLSQRHGLRNEKGGALDDVYLMNGEIPTQASSSSGAGSIRAARRAGKYGKG